MRPTHTFVELPISKAAHAQIKKKLLDAGYGHIVIEYDDGCKLDMHGIALTIEKPKRKRPAK